MGNKLGKFKKPNKSDYPFNEMAETEEVPTTLYFIQYFQNINHATQAQMQSLKIRIIDIVKASSLEKLDYDSIISYYFCFPHAKSVDLIFIVDKISNKDQGFHLSIKIEEYLETENSSKENKYIISKGCLGVNSELKIPDLYKIISAAFINLNKIAFSQNNYIHSDVFISPAIYLNVHKACQIVIPSSSKEISNSQLEFLIKVRNSLLLNPVSLSDPLLVQTTTRLSNSEIDYWKSGYHSFPEEVKYFIDQTQLEINTGMLYMTVINLIRGNTLNLPAKDYLPIPKIEAELYTHIF